MAVSLHCSQFPSFLSYTLPSLHLSILSNTLPSSFCYPRHIVFLKRRLLFLEDSYHIQSQQDQCVYLRLNHNLRHRPSHHPSARLLRRHLLARLLHLQEPRRSTIPVLPSIHLHYNLAWPESTQGGMCPNPSPECNAKCCKEMCQMHEQCDACPDEVTNRYSCFSVLSDQCSRMEYSLLYF